MNSQGWNNSWLSTNPNKFGVRLNTTNKLTKELSKVGKEVYLYTHHQIYLSPKERLYQTRSSPNWEGGMVTYATCKHLMRTYSMVGKGTWLIGLCPKECANNCVLFIGRIWLTFPSNYALSRHVKSEDKKVFQIKSADNNPRGDLYTPKRPLSNSQVYDHRNFKEPPNHTRSVEYYSKSPGSTSIRKDGKIPKWWRDIEYLYRGVRPPSYIISPCWLFSKPMLWIDYNPGRACLKLTGAEVVGSLH